jgi:hypothetical protein
MSTFLTTGFTLLKFFVDYIKRVQSTNLSYQLFLFPRTLSSELYKCGDYSWLSFEIGCALFRSWRGRISRRFGGFFFYWTADSKQVSIAATYSLPTSKTTGNIWIWTWSAKNCILHSKIKERDWGLVTMAYLMIPLSGRFNMADGQSI